jgi:hypothetical protein
LDQGEWTGLFLENYSSSFLTVCHEFKFQTIKKPLKTKNRIHSSLWPLDEKCDDDDDDDGGSSSSV